MRMRYVKASLAIVTLGLAACSSTKQEAVVQDVPAAWEHRVVERNLAPAAAAQKTTSKKAVEQK